MTSKEEYQKALTELYKQRNERYKVFQKHKDWSKEIKKYDKVGDCLQLFQELIDQHIYLRQLIETGDIFSPQEFYDEYESCLKGDGIAVFIMKDLSVSSDFKTCWNILENCVDKYDIFDRYECQIAFVIWFNR